MLTNEFDWPAALAELQKVSPLSEDRCAYPIAHALTGQRPAAEREALELESLSKKEYVPATIMASVWAALGERERTLLAVPAVSGRPVPRRRLRVE